MSNKFTIPNVPIGKILEWHGLTTSIPQGWHICDGEDGTLNLISFFIGDNVSNYTEANTTAQNQLKFADLNSYASYFIQKIG